MEHHHQVLIDRATNEGYGGLTEAEETEHGRVLYQASFAENEVKFVSYTTWSVFLIGLLLTVLYGFGSFE